MSTEDSGLDDLFQRYRAACPDVEPSATFMPVVWQKIEARRGFWSVFERLARTGMAAAAVLCLLLLALNFVTANQRAAFQSYTDALMADHSAEQTYYTEAIRSTPSGNEVPAALRH
ncbi:MAG TPA: hypothetical protein VLI55_17940 [Bryobacteraceae bacterium]|nr:hypothetical protein [Bryobacteraceae bacterium]